MAESSLTLTLDELRVLVARFMSFGNAATDLYSATLSTAQKYEVDRIIARGLRQFYSPPPVAGERTAHRWSFLRKSYVIVLHAPVTMTDVVVSCVDGYVTTTGNESIPSWIAGCAVRFGGSGQLYSIAVRDSNNGFTLDDTSASPTVGDTITFYDGTRALPDDFGGAEGNVTYGDGAIQGFLQQTSDEWLRAAGSMMTFSGPPQRYAIRPKTWPTSGATGTRQEIVMRPLPDQAYAVRMTYKVLPQQMTSATDCPLGATDHGGAIIASCLAIAEEYAVTEKSEYRSVLWPQALAASVALDRGSGGGNLGYNGGTINDVEQYNSRRMVDSPPTTYTP